MLNFLSEKIPNVKYKYEVQRSNSKYRLAKQKHQLMKDEVVAKNGQTQHLQDQSLQISIIDPIQIDANSFLCQPQFKLLETYCENLKTQDKYMYYIYFNNVHPSIYKKSNKVEKLIVKQEKSCVFDHQIPRTSPQFQDMQVRTFFKSIIEQLIQEVFRTYTQNDPNPVKLTDDEITKIAREIVRHSGLHLNCMRLYCSIYPPTGDDHTRRIHFSNLSSKVKQNISGDELQASYVAPDTYSFPLSTYYYYILNSGATIEKANMCYQQHSNLSTAFSSLEIFQQFIVCLKMLLQNSFEIDFRQLFHGMAKKNKNNEKNAEAGTIFDNEAVIEKSSDEKNTVVANVLKQLDQCAYYYAVKFDVMEVVTSYNKMAENKEINNIFWRTVTADAENYGLGSRDYPVIQDGVLFNKYSNF